MTSEGFQEASEAAGKWRRANLTSAQLSTYFIGATELDAIRSAYENKHGPIKNWRQFHDAVLAHGSPAPRFVRASLGL